MSIFPTGLPSSSETLSSYLPMSSAPTSRMLHRRRKLSPPSSGSPRGFRIRECLDS